MITQRFSISPTGLMGLTLIMLLAGCAVGPDYKRPETALPAAYPEAVQATTGGEQTKIAADWWKLYGDDTLDKLVTDTLHNNVDLQRAVAQIDEAQAVLDQAGSALFPEVDINASSSRSRSSSLNALNWTSGANCAAPRRRRALRY